MQAPNNSATPTSSDDIEIDLGKYLKAVTSRWRLILTSIIIGSLLGGLFTLAFPPQYEAIASVAIIRNSTQIEFTPTIKTRSEDEILAQAQINDSRRTTLVGLVQNATIADEVLARFSTTPDYFTEEEAKPANLINRVKGELLGRGDLILIKVRDNNAVRAADIANAWATSYQGYVNSLYVGAPKSLAINVEKLDIQARDEYQAAQKALETFIATSQEDDLVRQIGEKQKILDSLQQGRQSAVTLVISEQLRVNSAIIATYLNAQSGNRLIAFEKEQAGRRDLISTMLDAQNAGNVQPIREQLKSNLDSLSLYYSALVKTRQYLLDARSMRVAIETGGDSAARSNASAISLLKTQAFALSVPASGTVELRIEQPGDSATFTAESQLVDISSLIKALESREIELTSQIDRLSIALQSGTAYSLSLPNNRPTLLTTAISESYGSLFDVGQIGQLSENVAITNALTVAAQDRANEIVGSQLTGLSNNAADTPTNAVFTRLQNELRQAQAQLENQQAQKDRLFKERNLKRETSETLSRKLTEVGLSQTISGSEVIVASNAVVPTSRATSRFAILGIAALVGLLIGIVLAFIHEARQNAGQRISGGSAGMLDRTARWIFNE